ncbi:hypothetical protein 7711_00060 [Pseudomonas phage bmx-p1]|nr:hypothetical protein 7711_00060 [Pseudomonas phage bmx-p1]
MGAIRPGSAGFVKPLRGFPRCLSVSLKAAPLRHILYGVVYWFFIQSRDYQSPSKPPDIDSL